MVISSPAQTVVVETVKSQTAYAVENVRSAIRIKKIPFRFFILITQN